MPTTAPAEACGPSRSTVTRRLQKAAGCSGGAVGGSMEVAEMATLELFGNGGK